MSSLGEVYRDLAAHGVQSDKGSDHSYIQVYEDLFASLHDGQPVNVLEIGVLYGHSLALWRDYFGPKARVWGVDLNPTPVQGVAVVKHDATDPRLVDALDRDGYDLVIDDGSHLRDHQAYTFTILKPLLRKGALYVIEDLQDEGAVAYVRKYTGVDWEVIDLRAVKGRWDDVLMVHRT